MKPTRTRSNKRSTVLLLSLLAAVAAPFAASAAAETTFRDIKVEVVGNGVPVLMVPGLNSNADTWRDTCQALQPQVQCHMVSLPGFAGRPAVEGDAFLVPLRDRLPTPSGAAVATTAAVGLTALLAGALTYSLLRRFAF